MDCRRDLVFVAALVVALTRARCEHGRHDNDMVVVITALAQAILYGRKPLLRFPHLQFLFLIVLLRKDVANVK